ncbi:hypothetical protein YTPLAS73_13500 [Nitrosarchaeum sp.]|nr:hypothetical protein YTPLAS73_13500 [Nitrosarchaeum sp.]
MRIDSCRKCGKTLEVNKKCKICNHANEFFCHVCGYAANEQIHSKCMLKNDAISWNAKYVNSILA